MKFANGFVAMAARMGEEERGRELVSRLPAALADQELSYDQMTSHVRYNFGLPFQHQGIPFAYGTTQMPELSTFTLVFVTASNLLDALAFDTFCGYLFNPGKHQDAMLEFRPVLTSKPMIGLEYETKGRGDRKIDWKFTYADRTIILDVKNRSGKTYEHLVAIIKNPGQIPIPNTNPDAFFKSTFDKFEAVRSPQVLQGVWVNVGIKENAKLLDAYFQAAIDPGLLQFYVIAGWGSECHVKARTLEQEEVILAAFGLVRSDQYIF